MKNNEKRSKSIIDLLKDEDTMREAFRLARQDAIRRHKFANVPMSFWEDGRVIEVPADEIELRDDTITDGE